MSQYIGDDDNLLAKIPVTRGTTGGYKKKMTAVAERQTPENSVAEAFFPEEAPRGGGYTRTHTLARAVRRGDARHRDEHTPTGKFKFSGDGR
jgi:hypothetical protein